MLKSNQAWSFLENDELNTDVFEQFNIEEVTKQLLLQRGIDTTEKAEQFLYPSLKQLIAPDLLKDIDLAVKRIQTAIRQGERILVYGDYDADGVTSTTLLIDALEELGAHCDFYIPNRFTEGYGPNEEAFRKAKEADVKLIITVDNGISAVHEANVAKELDIDLIITDHHELQDPLPDAYCIIHPKVSDDYAFKELAGVGVAFKLAQELLGYFPKQYLDLVAIGTVADMVPLLSENRIFTKFGLDVLTETTRPGLIALKELVNLKEEVTETDIGFLIGPRLNAVGRLQDASLAVELLRAEDLDEARQIAEEVQQLNQERQTIVTKTTKEITEKLDEIDELPSVLIVSNPNWNEGVLGIVASQLVRRYERPAIVLKEHTEAGLLKGSARSIKAFDLFTHCMKAIHLFDGFGGHSQAAGMTLKIENKQQLEDHLIHEIEESISEEDFKEKLEIAGALTKDQLTEKLVTEINALRPYGMDNEKPLFYFKGTPNDIRQLGQKKNHLKLQFGVGSEQVEGIGFQKGDLYEQIAPNDEVELIGELNINEWNGFRKVQMIIRDARVEHWQLFDYRGRTQLPSLIDKERTLVVHSEESEHKHFDQCAKQTYEQIDHSLLDSETYRSLVLCDLPCSLSLVKEIITRLQPEKIYACFHTEASTYLKKIPSRDEFKQLYALIFKNGAIDLSKDGTRILKHMNWQRGTLQFVIDVFLDLGFIKVDGSTITKVDTPEKQPLESSKTYKEAHDRQKLEEILYYTNYEELKDWIQKSCFLEKREGIGAAHGL